MLAPRARLFFTSITTAAAGKRSPFLAWNLPPPKTWNTVHAAYVVPVDSKRHHFSGLWNNLHFYLPVTRFTLNLSPSNRPIRFRYSCSTLFARPIQGRSSLHRPQAPSYAATFGVGNRLLIQNFSPAAQDCLLEPTIRHWRLWHLSSELPTSCISNTFHRLDLHRPRYSASSLVNRSS